ncbi:MAG: hypothetical protein ACLUUO_15915 [Sellimonas intestinalis]
MALPGKSKLHGLTFYALYEAVGARSVENQQHRLTASEYGCPVGMKI